MHNAGFNALGIDSVYMSWPLPPSGLEKFVEAVHLLNIQGCSITIPHKMTILPLLDGVDEPARLAGAVNTLYWKDGKLYGENTDVAGFLSPLKNYSIADKPVLLLGAGGAACAAASGLRLLGCAAVRVASRGDIHQYELAEKFGFTAIAWKERYSSYSYLIINATPAGMKGETENQTPYDFAEAPDPGHGLVYDLVYNPLQTKLVKDAIIAGRDVISGLEMFFWQGDAQFMHWTGRHLPAQSRQAITEALGAKILP